MKILTKKKIIDRAAHWSISFGGMVVIIVILVLFIFIFMEVFPLLIGPRVLEESTCSLNGKAVLIDTDEYQEIAYAVYEDGNVDFISLSDERLIKSHSIKEINGSTITAVSKDKDRIVLGTKEGKVITLNIGFSVSFEDEERIITPEISDEKIVFTYCEGKGIQYITSKGEEEITVTTFYTEDGSLILKSTEIEKSLFGGEEKKETVTNITAIFKEAIHDKSTEQGKELTVTSLTIDLFMQNLYVGTTSGEIIHINVRDRENPFLEEKVKVSDEPVTSLGFLLGDVSLVVGDKNGNVNTWIRVRDDNTTSGWSLKKVHTVGPHKADIISIASSMRNKCFITASSDGTIHLKHATSEQTLLNLS